MGLSITFGKDTFQDGYETLALCLDALVDIGIQVKITAHNPPTKGFLVFEGVIVVTDDYGFNAIKINPITGEDEDDETRVLFSNLVNIEIQ